MVDEDRLRRLVAAEEGEDDDAVGTSSDEPSVAGAPDAAVEARLAELDDLDTQVSRGMDAELATLSALANPTRYHLVKLLAADGELTVGELDAVVGVSQSAISHALADLAEAGLVERRREGIWRYYRTTDDAERIVEVLGELRE